MRLVSFAPGCAVQYTAFRILQGVRVGNDGVTLAWSLPLEGWQAATHVQLAPLADGVAAAAITYECAHLRGACGLKAAEARLRLMLLVGV